MITYTTIKIHYTGKGLIIHLHICYGLNLIKFLEVL